MCIFNNSIDFVTELNGDIEMSNAIVRIFRNRFFFQLLNGNNQYRNVNYNLVRLCKDKLNLFGKYRLSTCTIQKEVIRNIRNRSLQSFYFRDGKQLLVSRLNLSESCTFSRCPTMSLPNCHQQTCSNAVENTSESEDSLSLTKR